MVSYKIIHENERSSAQNWSADKIASLLKKNGLTVRSVSNNDSAVIAARKGTAGLFGSTLLHLGVLVLGVAAWVSYTKDATFYKDLAPGEVLNFESSSSSIKLDSFVVRMTDKGAVKSFQSHVSIYQSFHVPATFN
jgi:cytochrome c biogenesis protein ResB